MPRVAIVTGATQGRGLAFADGLAARLSPEDTVYLTGRNEERLAAAMASLTPGRAQVRTEVFDVADPDAAELLAATLEARHGGIDIVFSNAVMRVEPDDRPSDVIGEYVEVNNLGTTRVLRAFAPRVRDGGRLVVVASSLGTLHYLAPVLHDQFNSAASLDEVDDVVRKWREAVQTGSAVASAWPAFINIPSKIAQVAAVRTLAHSRREEDLRRDVLIAATCPGMIDTATSRPWFDTSNARSPAQAAGPLLDLVVAPARPDHYGELVRNGQVLPWTP